MSLDEVDQIPRWSIDKKSALRLLISGEGLLTKLMMLFCAETMSAWKGYEKLGVCITYLESITGCAENTTSINTASEFDNFQVKPYEIKAKPGRVEGHIRLGTLDIACR